MKNIVVKFSILAALTIIIGSTIINFKTREWPLKGKSMVNSGKVISNNEMLVEEDTTLIEEKEKGEDLLIKKSVFFGELTYRDNQNYIFEFKIKDKLSNSVELWLEYEFFGCSDGQSISRRINDEVAIGGQIGNVSNEWTKFKGKVNKDIIKEGINRIYLSAYEESGISLKIRDVKLSVLPKDNSLRELYVNQPVTKTLSGKFGYVQGYIQGKGSDDAEISINGKKIKRQGFEFEKFIVKPEDSKEEWTAEIRALFPDGEELITQVVFEGQITPDFYIPELGETQKIDRRFTKNDTIELDLANARIVGETNSLSSETNISITTLRKIDVPRLGSGMVNITNGAYAYRFLPHGTKFKKDVRIEIGYDKSDLPVGYNEADITTFYFDNDEKTWIALEKLEVDTVNNCIVSLTNHFTDFINAIIKVPESPEVNAYMPTSIKELKAADPLASFPLISPPTANNTGTANFSYPFQIPAGRQGMQPNIALQYNSSGGNGWLGLGFDISIPAITVETRWGVPQYNPNMESESYLVGGEQLLPLVYRTPFVAREITQTEKIFQPRIEGAFNKIIRHGTSPKNYWWEIIDKSGNKSYYGKKHNSDSLDINSVLRDSEGNIAHWALTETYDLFENKVQYFYDIELDAGIPNGTVMGKQIYIREIKYTGFREDVGKYRVVFIRENKNVYKRNDINITARYGFKEVTADLLKNVEVYYDTTLIKRYFFGYRVGEFKKQLLSCFGEASAEITESVSRICNYSGNDADSGFVVLYQFDYYNDIMTDDGLKPYKDNTTISSLTNTWGNLKMPLNTESLNQATMLGGSISNNNNYGGTLAIGIGGNVCSKYNSIGGSYNYSYGKSSGMLSIIDITGDGLPDIVYRIEDSGNDTVLRYKKQMYNSADNTYSFANSVEITGFNHFLKEENRTRSGGIEFSSSVNASGQYSFTNSYTKTYFSDVNGDGLPDIVQDGQIFFNMYNGLNNVSFSRITNDTIPFPGACENHYIVNSGDVSESILDVSDTIKPGILKDNRRVWLDAVRVWYVPYTGNITINAPIQLIEDTSLVRQMSSNVDGIKYMIQYNQSNLLKDSISADDYTSKVVGISNLPVNAGDRIYFRLQAGNNRSFDNVNWQKMIYYTNFDTSIVDPNGMSVYKFNSEDEFLFTGSQILEMPYTGKIRVNGNFVMPSMSDTVTLFITKNQSSNVIKRTFPNLLSINTTIDTAFFVNAGDIIKLSVNCSSNIKWADIEFFPEMYYDSIYSTPTNDVIYAIDPLGNHSVEFKPLIDYKTYPVTIAASTPQNFTALKYIRPAIQFNTPVSGTINFLVKTNNQIIAKRVLIIQNGLITNSYPTIPINPNQDVYFEFFTDDSVLVSSIQEFFINDGTTFKRPAGFHTITPINNLRFGSLYRGWGQFTYNNNGSDSVAMIESSLVLNEAFNTPIDTSNQFNLSDTTAMFNSIDNMINNPNFAYNPLNSTFLMMNPDVVSKSYKCFGDYTEIRKHYTSLSRMIMDLTFEDTPIPHYPNQPPPKAVNKHNVTEVYSRNYGAVSGPLSVGLSKSSNFSQVQCDFMDLNGDRFPDAIGPANVQYSKPQGGLSTVILPHYVPSMFAHMNESESIGAAIGGSYVETKEVVSNNTTQQKKSTSTAATISGSGAICEDNTIYTWVDVNGDGLPDKVNNNGEVALNLGYKFSELEDWNFVNIRNGISINGSLSIGYSMWNGSFSGGLGATESWNKTTSSLQDMNGDGLPDIVYQEGNTLKVCLNLGAEFSTPITWIDNTDDYSKGLTTNQSYNVAVSFGFPIPLLGIPFKIVINPSANWSVSVNRNLVQISDLDGDGYPDYLSSNDSEHLNVRYSTIGRTNMLKQVNNLASGYFAIDYTQSKNSFKSPQRMWVMSELKVFDGHIGDGVDLMRYTFEYDSAVYSRYDRQSLGFKTVKTHQHKTSSSQVVYRTTTEKYHNDAKKYLFKGLKYYDEIASANGEKFIVNTYKFDLKEINSGFVINDANAHCMGAGYPALSEKSTFFYEGQQNYQKSVRERYEHGTNGNVIKYYYDGEMTSPNNAEKFYAEIYYHPDIEGVNLLSIPEQIIVKNNVGAVLQKRQTEINYFNGSVDKIKTFYDDNNFADYLFTYYSNGNLHTFSKPLDVNNDRYTIIYQYDNVVQQYPISVTDVMGYSSSTNYDYKWGSVLSSIDITGNEMQYQYDSRNRLISVRGPYEIENHIPYAIKHQYFTPNNSAAPTVPWAMTKHFNPDYNDDIITITFADGLGRIVQTKKSSIVYNPITDYYDPLMTVSGKVIYDDFGRVVEQYYPITETLGNETVFNPNFDGVNPTVLKYDILDRKTQTILPDNVTENISYDIQNDAYNKKQFQTTIVDFNQKSTVIYTDFKGQKTSITDPLQNVTKFNYSPIGLMTESYDPENIQTKYFYDIAGRLTCRIHPDAGQTSYTYDKTGKVLSMKTQDLDNRNVEINYEYHYNQLIYTSYPDNPEMNVRYTYGDPSSGNQAGRLLYQQDATGLQEFSYGKLGELIKNVRTFVLPEQFVYTFTMEWQYDTWNRIRQVTYPDGEIVGYNYDRAGMIDQVYGVKGNQTFNYVNRHGYDKFGNKNMMQYSNGITTFYEYDNVRRRLTRLVGKDSYGDRIQDITYTYDAANNITKVEKSAERGVGGVPYSTTITYQYDDLYRMTCSGGLMLYNNNGNYMFKMCLAYSPSGNISTKQLDSEILTVNGDENKFYYFNYAYQGNQPHALSSLRYDNGEKLYEWTPNGNMQKEEDYYGGSLVATRKMHWDEENRLTTLLDVDKTLNYYTYDAAGERTLKLTGNYEEMNINGQYNINAYNLNTYTLYTSPYMVIDPKGYTKHYYIESDRFVSKIGGGMANINYNIREDHVYGMDINDPSDYENKSRDLFEDGMMSRHFDIIDVHTEVIKDYDFRQISKFQEYDEVEKHFFFYHKDHLGSSTQISNIDANIIHHIEYMPSGEQFSEQRDNWATPYKFNGKELDQETGLYYYGARYYTPEIGIWLSVDPMSDKYPSLSPYAYCGNNPVMLVDPDGREIVVTGTESNAYVSQLSTKNLNIYRNDNDGTLGYNGKAKTRVEKQMVRAIESTNVTVNICAENTNKVEGENANLHGGAFLGTIYEIDENGVEHVNSYQQVNPKELSKMDSDIGTSGMFARHEMTEPYEAGLISLSDARSSPRAGLPGSVYDIAHGRASFAHDLLKTTTSVNLPKSVFSGKTPNFLNTTRYSVSNYSIYEK